MFFFPDVVVSSSTLSSQFMQVSKSFIDVGSFGQLHGWGACFRYLYIYRHIYIYISV